MTMGKKLRPPLLHLTSWSVYYKYKHLWKMEKRKKKYFTLILAVSIMHGNATGDKLTQHSAPESTLQVCAHSSSSVDPWESFPL